MRKFVLGLCSVAGALGVAGSVRAESVNIDWYSVNPASSSPVVADFKSPVSDQCCSYYYYNTPNPEVTVGVPLQVSAGNPAGLAEGPGGTLPWWTPTPGAITFEGQTTQSLPIAQNMFVPEGTGNTDATDFQTAILWSSLHVGSGGATITFGGDDDVFLALDGDVVFQLGGIHGAGTTTSYSVLPGNYEMEVYYADRHTVAAYLDLSISGDYTTDVPEASTWAMMLAGFAGLGFAGFRRGVRRDAIA
jgi:fibro-slime domain-containing protein